jgi:hypothetical protein
VPDDRNYLLEAFKSQYNLIGLATAAGFAILSGSFLPLLLAAGVELTMLPVLERYQRYRRAKGLDDEKERRREVEREEMLRALDDDERDAYGQIEKLAEEIRQNYTALDPSSQILLDELVRKLDFLVSFYLRMRYSIVRYRRYFETAEPGRIQDRLAALDKEMAQGPQRVQEIKAKTKAVLQKRMQRYEKALENKQLIDAQTETVEEVLQLLRDQSYSMRDPRSITEQLDGLVSSAEETEKGVRDMEDILAIEQDALMPGLDLGSDEDLTTAAAEPPAAAPRTPTPAASGRPVRAVPPPLRAPNPPEPTQPPERKKLTH